MPGGRLQGRHAWPRTARMNPQSYGNIAPRVGFAWDVNGDGKTAVRAGVGRFFLRERVSPYLAMSLNPPFSHTASGWRYLDSTARDGVGLSAGVPRNGYTQETIYPSSWQWNVSVEREIYRNTTLMVGYVGNRGMHNLRAYDVNQVRTGDINSNGVDDRLDYARSSGNAGASAAVQPYGVFGDMQITDVGPQRRLDLPRPPDAARLALLERLVVPGLLHLVAHDRERDAGELERRASDDRTNVHRPRQPGPRPRPGRHPPHAHRQRQPPAHAPEPGGPPVELRPQRLRRLAGHRASCSTPRGRRSRFSPGASRGSNGIGGTGDGGTDRPNVVPGQSTATPDSGTEQILNPAAWTLNGYKLGTNGNSGRGSCYGPSYFQTDLALYKNINLTERVKMQLRFEAFNIFNTVNFKHAGGNWTYNPTSRDPRRPPRTRPPRSSRRRRPPTSVRPPGRSTRGSSSSGSSSRSEPLTWSVKEPRAFGPGAFSFRGDERSPPPHVPRDAAARTSAFPPRGRAARIGRMVP